jgi:large exoprotein involved in heme utilization and adhesion
VLGADVSTIQGAIRANGQVFLLNPNGVLFTPTAQVNVGGLVASTLNLSDQDFLAGRYVFEGASRNSVVNQGSLNANNGTVALVAAKIVNESGASISADRGQVLLGAGRKVTLDLGGPVRIRVNEGALEALIDQGGAVRADGGLVYLTAKAAETLTRTVIQHTGTARAQTVATGEKGQIYLMGGMDKDRINVSGSLDASAPQGGDGGFIETSAAHALIQDGVQVNTLAADGHTGKWLIDPVDIRVSSSGGTVTGATLSTALNTTNVTLDTNSTGSCTGVSCGSFSGSAGVTLLTTTT